MKHKNNFYSLIFLFLPVLLLLLNSITVLCEIPEVSISTLQEKAKKFNTEISTPDFETTPAAINESVNRAINEATLALNKIVNQDKSSVTFESTLQAMEFISNKMENIGSRIYLIMNTHPDKKIRKAAEYAVNKFNTWEIQTSLREDLYDIVQALAAKKPKLKGEDKRLFKTYVDGYKRRGFHLDAGTRRKIGQLEEEISKLSTEFNSNIRNAKSILTFTRLDLIGVSEDFIQTFKVGENEYRFDASIASNATPILTSAIFEETRKSVYMAMNTVAMDKNVALLEKVIKLKLELANILGYETWADYQFEPKMAKDKEEVNEYLENLRLELTPKLEEEQTKLLELKRLETRNPNATLEPWDISRYTALLNKREYAIDTQELRNFFPMEKTIEGMFNVFEDLFSIKFQEVHDAYKWVQDVRLISVTDKKTNDLIIKEFMNRCYKTEDDKPCKTIFFCVNVAHADELKRIFERQLRRPFHVNGYYHQI